MNERDRAAAGVMALVRTVVGAAGIWRVYQAVAFTIGIGITAGLSVASLVPLVLSAGMAPGDTAATDGFFRAVTWISGERWSLEFGLIAFVGLTWVQGLLTRWQASVSVGVQQDVAAALRRRVFDAVCRMDWVWFARSRSSDLLQALTGDVDRLANATYLLLSVASAVTLTTIYVVIAMSVSAATTAATLAAGGVLMLLVSRQRTVARSVGRDLTEASESLYAALTESFVNMKTIRSFGVERHHASVLADAQRRLRLVLERATASDATARLWFATGSVALLATVAYIALRVVGIPAAQLVILLFVFMRLTPQLSALQQDLHRLAIELSAFETLHRIEAVPSSAVPARPAVRVPPMRRALVLERVAFHYDSERILDDVDLVVPAGRTVALIGPSGAGKSTLADIVLGLLEPSSGRMLVDGTSIDSDRRADWRRQVGYVPQETILFHDTIRQNLLWARPDARDRDLWDALSAAAAESFVRSLPLGLDTIVGDRGVRLSGGERQRIALARALVGQPALLVLDEATSALDVDNERDIQSAIDRLQGQATVLVISHRLTAVRHADTIYVLEEGRIVESGPWDVLVARPHGRLRALSLAQGLAVGADALAEVVTGR